MLPQSPTFAPSSLSCGPVGSKLDFSDKASEKKSASVNNTIALVAVTNPASIGMRIFGSQVHTA